MSSAAGDRPFAATTYHQVSARVLGIADKLRELGVDKELQLRRKAADGSTGETPSTSTGGGWSANVKLSRNFDAEGRELSDKPPLELFCSVLEPSQISTCVTAAQAVLLNPSAVETQPGKARAFVPDLSGPQPKASAAFQALGDAAARYELPFTANKVVLEIYGADADLTIIDLPGIIHDHPKGKEYVKIVERMTKQNLAPNHHIIAMALPAGLDPETQAIRLWVREVDPVGDRSIGIITKPDTISDKEQTAYGKLIRLVAGQPTVSAADDHTRLQHGYYVVRNPGQEELQAGITFAAAREAEATYFNENLHLARAAVVSPALAHRLGTKNLRDGLSALLVGAIERQLPLMRRAAHESLAAIEQTIARLPPPPTADALHELRGLLCSAAEQLGQDVHATGSGEKTFCQSVQKVYRSYGERVIRSTPAFLVGCTLVSALAAGDKVLLAGRQQRPQLDLKWADGSVLLDMYGGTTEAEAAQALAENQELLCELETALFPCKHMTLEEVQRLHQKHLGEELPGFSPYSALVELIRTFKGQWAEHAAACLKEVAALTQELADAVVAGLFSRYPKALRVIRPAVSQYVEGLRAEAASAIRSLTDTEDRDIFTLNGHYFRDQFTTFLGRLKRAYNKGPKLDTTKEQQVRNLLGQLAGFGYTFRNSDDLLTCQPTEVDDELRIMAACLAYFKVVFKRIQDEVPLHIRSVMLRQLVDRQKLEDTVLRHISAKAGSGRQKNMPAGAGLAEEAKALLAEEEGLAQQRLQLRGLERRLREALEVLNDGDDEGM